MKKIIILISCLLLTGCITADKLGYIKVSKAQEQLESLKIEYNKKMDSKTEEVTNGLKTLIKSKDNQMQEAANSIWAAGNAFKFYEKPTRLDLIINNRIDEAKAALGLAPTLAAMEKEQKRLIEELDETKTTLDQLKSNHAQVVKENEKLVEQTQLEKDKVTALEEQKKQLESDYGAKITAAQNDVIKEQGKVIIAQNESAEKTKYIEANKRYMMIGLGGISVVALIIAIYLPLYKKESFTLAGITGGLALCVPFLQPVHFAIVFGLGITLGLLVLARKMGIGHKVNENLISAIQEFKEKEPEKYAALKPLLEEYNKKYQGKAKVEDKAATGHIEEILKDYEKI